MWHGAIGGWRRAAAGRRLGLQRSTHASWFWVQHRHRIQAARISKRLGLVHSADLSRAVEGNCTSAGCTVLQAPHLLGCSAWRCHRWGPCRAWARGRLQKHRCNFTVQFLECDCVDPTLWQTYRKQWTSAFTAPAGAGHPTQRRRCPTRCGCWVRRGRRQQRRRAAHLGICIDHTRVNAA
jgi:hypothetical protein